MQQEYKSPKYKLLIFFEESRNKWKARAKKSIEEIKKINHKYVYQKKKHEALKAENKELRAQLALLTKVQKKKIEFNTDALLIPVVRHSYSLGHISMMLSLIMTSISLRCASRALDVFRLTFNISISTPSWYTSRLWLLKLGYYKLNKPKEIADDWLWIVDHSVQLGCEKCMVILGIRQKDLPCDRALTFSDVEPIEVLPVTKSNGDIVYEQLSNAAKKTGVPRGVISDGGPDLKRGVEKFVNEHQGSCYIYDIKHQVALILKKELESDVSWASFIELAAKAQNHMRQSSVAAFAPPNQRSKARYMNVDILVSWAKKIIDMPEEKCADLLDENKQKKFLGWIDFYEEDINRWSDLSHIANTVVSFITNNNLNKGVSNKLRTMLPEPFLCSRTNDFQNTILNKVAEKENQLNIGETLLGSSDIIESLFGKFKNIEKEQASSGFTNLLLALPAIVGELSTDIIKSAMEETKVSSIWNWLKSNIGQSVQSKRKEAFSKPTKENKNRVILTA